MSETGSTSYDTVELRRRIAGAFSAGELRALAESLGVGGIAWERGVQDAAREVVRQCERYAGLPALVARLREERPLVEWPEPIAASATPSPVAAPSAAPLPPTNVHPAFPVLTSSPGSLGPPQPGAPPYVAGAPVGAVPPVVPSRAAGLGSTAMPPAPPRGAGWPGVTTTPSTERPFTVDPRILMVGAGLMVTAVVLAYLIGRTVSPTGSAVASPGASAAESARPRRSDSPAALAAATFSRSFANLARVCELPPSAGAGVHVFQSVAERCGPVPPARRVVKASSPASRGNAEPAPPSTEPPNAEPPSTEAEPPSTEAEPPSTEAEPPRNKRPGRGGNATPGEAPPSPPPVRGGCLGACEAQHAGCRAHCGPEPLESSRYEGYQRCQSQCLRNESRCKLACR